MEDHKTAHVISLISAMASTTRRAKITCGCALCRVHLAVSKSESDTKVLTAWALWKYGISIKAWSTASRASKKFKSYEIRQSFMKIQSDKHLERSMRIMRISSNSREILCWTTKNQNHPCIRAELVYLRIQRKAHPKRRNKLRKNHQLSLFYPNQKIKRKMDKNLLVLHHRRILLLQHHQQGRDQRIQGIQ